MRMKFSKYSPLSWVVVLLILCFVLWKFSPSYVSVNVSGPEGEISIHQGGVGPQQLRIEQSGLFIESSTR